MREKKERFFEVNFDGIVGPTHNYSGLSFGNVASKKHENEASNPKEAALQGLEKMKALLDLGVKQAVLPPHERPYIPILRRLGFSGTDQAVIESAAKSDFSIYKASCSASSMWAANSATFTSSLDTEDGFCHFSPANLTEKFHRSIEWPSTSKILKTIFYDATRFIHHDALPAGQAFSDEGAANHTRLSKSHSDTGIHFFVFGRYAFKNDSRLPSIFPARQTFEASEAIGRLHKIPVTHRVMAQQDPSAIDAGVFHNDVAAVGNENVLLVHKNAYLDIDRVLSELSEKFLKVYQSKLHVFIADGVSLEEAVRSYVFNSQLVTLPSGKMLVIAPEESREFKSVERYLNSIQGHDSPIEGVRYFDLRQSMSNGGGPACLRLRVLLSQNEMIGVLPGVFLSTDLYTNLHGWICRHYRDCLRPMDLADPALLVETQTALDELTRILGLGSVYEFQRGSN